jgi:phenylpropionate dioxygenase-like ring-hydroxylating dioxygenase large terminal subunit
MIHENTAAQFDREVAEALIGHIRARTTDQADGELLVPIANFVDKERAQAEIALLKTLPLAIGHVCEIPKPGDFITREILGNRLIITRRRDGSVRAFRNMCRHRGGIIEQAASGNKRTFMCQYHGWSYDSEDGHLRPVFYKDDYGPIDAECSGLHTVRVEVRYGLIYVNLSAAERPPLADYFGPRIDAQVNAWNLDKSILYMEKVFTLPINWKLVMDGGIDTVHSQFLHPKPGGVGSRTVNLIAVYRAFGRHCRMYMARSKLKKLIDAGEPLESSSKYIGSILMLYPNSLLSSAPDHVEFWTVWPSPGNPSESTVKIRFYVRPEILNPEMEERINKSWDILSDAALTEDFPMEAAIQHNAQTWPAGHFRYGRNEISAQHLHRQLERDLGEIAANVSFVASSPASS